MAKLRRIHGLHRGKKIRVKIESLAPGGDGVAHHEGVAVFVARTAPGDTVEVELFDVRKSFARGKAIELVEESKERTRPVCAVFDRCGGCQWQHIEYAAQLKEKHEIVAQALRHIDGVEVEDVLPAPSPTRYRNKAQFPVQQNRRGKLLAGYFQDGSHTIVDLDECPVQPELLDTILKILKQQLTQHEISAYDEESHEGLIRHICARQSFHNNQILITLVLNADELDRSLKSALQAIATSLVQQVEEVKGFCINFNSSKGNKIFGSQTICIEGESEIEEVLQSKHSNRPQQLKDGIKFRLSSLSFFQVNTAQAANLFDEVYDRVAMVKERLGKPLRVIDAYAGVGSIALWVSSLAESIVAIEENPNAVKDGHKTVAHNNVHNIEFAEGRSEDVLARMAKEKFDCDLVILDPPRKGVAAEVLDALQKLAPKFVIYVSCNPQTLARDLKILQDGVLQDDQEKQVYTGYKTLRVKPVDLFPQTYHIESVATLERFLNDGAFGNLEKI